MPTENEVAMADAYGSQAQGQFRKKGVKYNKERLMNRIKTPGDLPGGKAQIEALAAQVAGYYKPSATSMDAGDRIIAKSKPRVHNVKRNQFL